MSFDASDVLVSRNARYFQARFCPRRLSAVGTDASDVGAQLNSWAVPTDVTSDFEWDRIGYDFDVIPYRHSPAPWDVHESPWPLNEIPFTETGANGGGRPGGRTVYMDRLIVAGRLALLPASEPSSCWDSVRIIVAIDFRPGVKVDGAYKNPTDDLFLPPDATRSHTAFAPDAFPRFRVLHDQRFHLRPRLVLASLEDPVRPIDLRMVTPAHPIVFNPDDLTFPVLSQSNALQVGISTASMPTMTLPYTIATGGGIIGPSPIPPAPPQIIYDQQAFNDVSSQAIVGGPSADQNLFEISEVESRSTVVPDLNPSNIAGGTLVAANVGDGDLGVDVHIDVDLSRYYCTYQEVPGVVAPDNYRLVSGAVWLFIASENAEAHCFDFTLESSSLRSTLYYVSE